MRDPCNVAHADGFVVGTRMRIVQAGVQFDDRVDYYTATNHHGQSVLNGRPSADIVTRSALNTPSLAVNTDYRAWR